MRVDEVVELRVHGVSGTPPEELLDRPLVEQVAGDAVAGFYRPRLVAERTDSWPAGDPDPVVRGPQLEGYAWGGLTSGAPSRAFWLLLLPFTLANVAPRMRPPDPDLEAHPERSAAARRRVRLLWYASRLLAATLTVVLVAAFVGIGVDLVGWQCGSGSGRCDAATPKWIMSRLVDLSPAHRMAVGALLPLAALGFLWFVSGRTIANYETVTPEFAAAQGEEAATWADVDPNDALEPGLRSRWMWQNYWVVRRLRALHVQLGLAAALGMLSPALTTAGKWADGLVAVAVAGYAAVAFGLRSVDSRLHRTRWTWTSRAAWVLLGGSWLATLAWLVFEPRALDPHLARCATTPSGSYACAPAGGLPRFADTILWLLFVELVLLLVVTATLAVMRWRAGTGGTFGEPGPRVAIGGWGTGVLHLTAVFLASVFTAGAYLYAAAWLQTGSLKPGFGTVSSVAQHFAVPEAILDAGLAYSVSVGVLLVVLVGVVVWTGLSLGRIGVGTHPVVPGAFAADYPDGGGTSRADVRRRGQVLRALWLGRVVDLAGPLLGWLVFAGAVLTYVVAGVLFAEHVLGAGATARWLAGRGGGGYRGFFSPASLQGTGAYLAVWTLLLLVVLGGAAFRARPTRRSVGILWDLASFWPRLAHPLAPPCYAERTVPDLLTRIRWHVGSGRGVVVAAHSQGTVIGTAALLQLRTDDALTAGPRTLPKVGLLTFGCVLRRLYGRFFPAYFGPATLRRLQDTLSPAAGARSPGELRWRNLWRYTDYLGGPVACGPPPRVASAWQPGGPCPDPVDAAGLCIDLHLLDPPFAVAPGDTVYRRPLRHSAFWTVPEFSQAVVRVAETV